MGYFSKTTRAAVVKFSTEAWHRAVALQQLSLLLHFQCVIDGQTDEQKAHSTVVPRIAVRAIKNATNVYCTDGAIQSTCENIYSPFSRRCEVSHSAIAMAGSDTCWVFWCSMSDVCQGRVMRSQRVDTYRVGQKMRPQSHVHNSVCVSLSVSIYNFFRWKIPW